MDAAAWHKAIDDVRIVHRWVPIHVSAGGHHGIFLVSADAIKVDGVRATCSARMLQQIADRLGAVLLTSKLYECRWQQATMMVPPSPADPGLDASGKQHSGRVDALIGGVAGLNLSMPNVLYSTVGKTWIIDNTCSESNAVNHGWIVPKSAVSRRADGRFAWMGIVVQRCQSIQEEAYIIQNRGRAHSLDYCDYSQVALLCRDRADINGSAMSVTDVYQDAELCKLVTHDGVPLAFARHPGVPRSGEAR